MKLGTLQRVILFVGIIVMVAMGVYPPWIYRLDEFMVLSHGYGWIFLPPEQYMIVDVRGLCVQWTVALIFFVGLTIISKSKKG